MITSLMISGCKLEIYPFFKGLLKISRQLNNLSKKKKKDQIPLGYKMYDYERSMFSLQTFKVKL